MRGAWCSGRFRSGWRGCGLLRQAGGVTTDQPEHDHTEVLDTLRAYRVALRVHLEEQHGLIVGTGDPVMAHDYLHKDD